MSLSICCKETQAYKKWHYNVYALFPVIMNTMTSQLQCHCRLFQFFVLSFKFSLHSQGDGRLNLTGGRNTSSLYWSLLKFCFRVLLHKILGWELETVKHQNDERASECYICISVCHQCHMYEWQSENTFTRHTISWLKNLHRLWLSLYKGSWSPSDLHVSSTEAKSGRPQIWRWSRHENSKADHRHATEERIPRHDRSHSCVGGHRESSGIPELFCRTHPPTLNL